MKALITGIGGFVGYHLSNELTSQGYDVYGMDVIGNAPNIKIANILDKAAVIESLSDIKPDCVFHLAAQASVQQSWDDPQFTFDINVKGTLNLLDAVRMSSRQIRIVIVGSSDQYGIIKPEDCPIKESFRSDPISPYAISKQAQEYVVKSYSKVYGMDIVMTRSFNHAGPGQRKGFVVSDFASRIAEIEKGAEPVLIVGNLEAKRDFTDVRDVVNAYRLLCEKGQADEIYNVGSGNVWSMRQILEMLISYSDCMIEIKSDPEKMRPSDLPIIQSNNLKLKVLTGWEPIYTIEQTLHDTLDYWRNKSK